MRDDIFKCFKEDCCVDIDPALVDEVGNLFLRRSKRLPNFDFFRLFTSLGKLADDMTTLSYYSDADMEDDIHFRRAARDFFFNVSILIKFMYPMMEQLDAAVDEHIDIEVPKK